MKPFLDLLGKGGPAMIAIMVLSVLLYSRCVRLLLSLRRSRAIAVDSASASADPSTRHLLREDVQQAFRQERIFLGAMIAAAPLLGLLGTVNGMSKTFASLTGRAGEKSMEGLAHGISEVLVATEAGLAVALPAMVIVFLAHRQVRRQLQELNTIEMRARNQGLS